MFKPSEEPMFKPSDGNSSGDGREEMARDPQSRLKEGGKWATSAAKEGVRNTADRSRITAALAADETADALNQTADRLWGEGHESLAQAASALSDNLSNLATRIQSRSLEEIAEDARRVARNNPALFVTGGLALGLVLSRFFKAAPEAEARELSEGEAPGQSENGENGENGDGIGTEGRRAAQAEPKPFAHRASGTTGGSRASDQYGGYEHD